MYQSDPMMPLVCARSLSAALFEMPKSVTLAT